MKYLVYYRYARENSEINIRTTLKDKYRFTSTYLILLVEASSDKYKMRISRTTVDKLGIQLYDNVSAAVAELIANSYDADAEKVTITLPLDKWLTTVRDGALIERGFEIKIEDDGHGITNDEANEFYLWVGKERRLDARQGPLSREKHRHVTGRKGIGKLAPFGVCKEIEVWSAGGEKDKGPSKITNFILKYDDIMVFQSEDEYHPTIGKEDGLLSETRGTKIFLRNFTRKRTPNATTFHRQLARRFSIGLPDFKITVIDSTGKEPPYDIGKFEIPLMDRTKIVVDERPVYVYKENEEGVKTKEIEETLKVTGWVAFSKESYRDEEMAGIRIYTRGKLASVTRDFGIKSGFTGENTIRSYVVGEIFAEWIDPDDGEDLNRTDRQDILWNTSRGRAFQDWGMNLLRELGRISRTPVEEKNWYIFLEKTHFDEKARETLPTPQLVERATNLGKLIGRRISEDEFEDIDKLDQIANVIIAVTPQFEWIDSIAEVKDLAEINLSKIASLFAEAKIGEITLLGQVASQRLGAIHRLRVEIDREQEVDEKVLQKIIEEAPWLINPQWTVFGATTSFKTVRERFEKWYLREYGTEITTSALNEDGKKPDFVLLYPGKRLEIVEIKKRWHAFENLEYDRIDNYINALDAFLDKNPDFQASFGKKCHVTLICDENKLTGAQRRAYESLIETNRLDPITWDVFLMRTIEAHQQFIDAIKILKK